MPQHFWMVKNMFGSYYQYNWLWVSKVNFLFLGQAKGPEDWRISDWPDPRDRVFRQGMPRHNEQHGDRPLPSGDRGTVSCVHGLQFHCITSLRRRPRRSLLAPASCTLRCSIACAMRWSASPSAHYCSPCSCKLSLGTWTASFGDLSRFFAILKACWKRLCWWSWFLESPASRWAHSSITRMSGVGIAFWFRTSRKAVWCLLLVPVESNWEVWKRSSAEFFVSLKSFPVSLFVFVLSSGSIALS